MVKSVGVVGLGAMGDAVARRLVAQGLEVAVWNRTSAPMQALEGAGARIASSPGEAAASGCVISFVANDEALRAVTLGSDGILAGLPEGGVHISMSSISPALGEELDGLHSQAGRSYVASPVFGRPEAAAAGRLWIAVAGPERAKAHIRPLQEKLSVEIFDHGTEPKDAHLVKVAGNFMIASAIESLSEAFALIKRSGADEKAFFDMMVGSIFDSVIYRNYGRVILDRNFSPPGFKLSLGSKDVGLALAAAAAVELSMPTAALLQNRFRESMDKGRGDLDWNALSLISVEDAQAPCRMSDER